jgi:cytoskeletal protein RodZ
MKTVGKQLQDARVAKGWSPELAARETKIRVDRVHDLEVDDYSNFSSPTYARGFVRTYARALGLDEYKILRQLDNKLPEDDNATFINEGGVPYIPEPSQVSKPFEVSRGVYVAGGVGATVLLLIGFILIQSYRAGYFASAPTSTPAILATNALPIAPETETARALPADSSAPPVALPVDNQPVATTAAPAASPTDTHAAPRALPVNLADLNGTAGTSPAAPAASAAPAPAEAPATTSLVTSATTPVVTAPGPAPAPAAVAETESAPAAATPAAAAAPSIAPAPDVAPVTTPAGAPAPADATASATVPTTITTPPRAMPVDLGATGAPANDVPAAGPADATEAPPARPQPHSASARESNSHSTVDVAAANSATDTLIASTASAEPATPVAAQAPAPAASEALTGAPDNAPAASPIPESSSPETSAPSSLGPAAPQGTAAPGGDSTSALTGAPAASDTAAPSAPPTSADPAGKFHGQRLVLTASHDSFVRVIALDGPDAGQVRYASTLHSGQSISFNDRKYSINVADSSAIDIALDGINYGPHREDSAPDTFTVESHTP